MLEHADLAELGGGQAPRLMPSCSSRTRHPPGYRAIGAAVRMLATGWQLAVQGVMN
jgi:hypothetical protein